MGERDKKITWVYIFSTLFMGCYSSALIDPAGDDKEKMYSEDIEYILTKDGTRHDFATPARIENEAVVGRSIQSVSIPLSSVVHGYSREGKTNISLDSVQFIVTKDSLKYEFDSPPRMSLDFVIVGNAVTQVSIPVSNVEYVHVTKISYVKTALLGVGIASIVAVVIIGASLQGVGHL